MSPPAPHQFLSLLKSTLRDRDVDYDRVIERFGQVRASQDRARGKKFDLRDHVRGLVLSLLSNQRPWRRIEIHLEQIEQIFLRYDPTQIKGSNPSRFEAALREIRCGNRNIHNQMTDLRSNIETFERIIEAHGSLDRFVTSESADEIARRLAGGKYKLKQVGFTLALEYLRNVGIRAPKSDLHVIRVVSGARLGFVEGEPSEQEAYDVMVRLADAADVNRTYLDNLLWLFCARDYGNICGAEPKCGICRLSDFCNYADAHA